MFNFYVLLLVCCSRMDILIYMRLFIPAFVLILNWQLTLLSLEVRDIVSFGIVYWAVEVAVNCKLFAAFSSFCLCHSLGVLILRFYLCVKRIEILLWISFLWDFVPSAKNLLFIHPFAIINVMCSSMQKFFGFFCEMSVLWHDK